MKRTTVLSIAFYATSLALVAGLTAHGADPTPPAPPTPSPACPNPCCDIDAQVAEMLEQLKDEERWFVFIDYQMGYSPFNRMSWKVTQKEASALIGEISATEVELHVKLMEGNATPEEREKMASDYKKRIAEIREMRRKYVRDVYLKVYKIPAGSLAYDAL